MSDTIKQKAGKLLISRSPVSRELFGILRFEFRAFRVRLNSRFNLFKLLRIKKLANSGPIFLNIGAGPFGEKGWVNLDLTKMKNISFTYDCRKHLPFNDNHVLKIRCEHFFEHLYYSDEVPQFLKECYRVLKPASCLRIIVPDGEKIVKAYLENTWGNVGLNPMNWHSPMHALNHVFHQEGEHKFCYDFETLEILLKKTGFRKITRQSYKKSLDADLINDQENHQFYSLYVDCVK